MTTKRKKFESTATRSGRVWGDVDGLAGKLGDARQRFMEQRPALTEAEWPAFRDAYDAALAATSRSMRW